MEIYNKTNTNYPIIVFAIKLLFQEFIILVKNMRQNVILRIPFITQIYPFKVDQSGIHTSIMGYNISFKFSAPKEPIPSRNVNMIRVHEKHILM